MKTKPGGHLNHRDSYASVGRALDADGNCLVCKSVCYSAARFSLQPLKVKHKVRSMHKIPCIFLKHNWPGFQLKAI